MKKFTSKVLKLDLIDTNDPVYIFKYYSNTYGYPNMRQTTKPSPCQWYGSPQILPQTPLCSTSTKPQILLAPMFTPSYLLHSRTPPTADEHWGNTNTLSIIVFYVEISHNNSNALVVLPCWLF